MAAGATVSKSSLIEIIIERACLGEIKVPRTENALADHPGCPASVCFGTDRCISLAGWQISNIGQQTGKLEKMVARLSGGDERQAAAK